MDMRYFNGPFPCMEPGAGPSWPGMYGRQNGEFGPGYGGPYGFGPGTGGNNFGWTGGGYGGGPGNCPPGTMPYLVRAGDTLSGLSRALGVPAEEISAMNPCIRSDRLTPGQTLCIPRAMPGEGTPHVIAAGETLQDIAGRYGLTVEELLSANPSLNPNYYRAGDLIQVPQANADAQPAMMYTIEPEDTLGSICIKCNTSVDMLRLGNPGFNPGRLTAGTRLRICPVPCEPRCVGVRSQMIPEGMDLVSCARALGVTTDELLMANPHLPPCRFTGGNAICLPDA